MGTILPLLRFEKREDGVSASNPIHSREHWGLSRPQHSLASSPWGIRMPVFTVVIACVGPPVAPSVTRTLKCHLPPPPPQPSLASISSASALPSFCLSLQTGLGRRDLPSFQGGRQCLILEASGDYIWIMLHPEAMFADS